MAVLRVATVIGTRPEATKMAPVVLALRQSPGLTPVIISSGQHRELLPQALGVFGLAADADLGVMTPGQGLEQITSRVLERCVAAFTDLAPDVVLVHGDTTTTLAAALAAFYCRIPVGHVEAGLRTGERYSPFPEEMNRLLADRLCEMHFAPTPLARDNLLREGVAPEGIFVTGNTGIDAVLLVAGPRRRRAPGQPRLVLVEAHRRENLGAPMERIAAGVRALAQGDPQLEIVWSVHPNPAVSAPVHAALDGLARVRLISPPGFDAWARLLAEADLLLTDSGGMQEEAPALGVPVLILRESTERPEVVQCGAGRLVGTGSERILAEARMVLDDAAVYRRMAEAGSPFGDGRAAQRTVQGILSHMGKRAGRPAEFTSAGRGTAIDRAGSR